MNNALERLEAMGVAAKDTSSYVNHVHAVGAKGAAKDAQALSTGLTAAERALPL